MDERHLKRIELAQKIFASFFQPNAPIDKEIEPIMKHCNEYSQLITKFATKYPIDKIARIDLAIIYLALYEIREVKKEPLKVIINEAIELAKEMGGDKSFSFVNAVLGKIVS